MVSAAIPRTPAQTARASGLSRSGKVLFVCVLLLGASAFPSVRPKIFGLLVHPVTVLAAVMFAAGLGELRRIPRAVALAMFAFTATFVLASLIGPSGGVSFSVKLVASTVTVAVAAMYLRTEADVRAVILAFAVAVALISIRGLYLVDKWGVQGINPMQGIANKNGFSLFALPALLLASYTALRPTTPTLQRWILVASCVFMVFAVFSTGNRSGWIGVILIALLLAIRAVRRFRTLLLLTTIAIAASALVMVFGDRLVIEDRMSKTTSEAPALRLQLVTSAFKVGLDNPILGASPQNLPREMARLSSVRGIALDSHNTTGLLVGGTGGLGFLTFLVMGWVLWRKPRRAAEATAAQREAHYLLRAMLILWLVRGQFTAEILYSPSFALALGISIGACIVAGVWSPRRAPAPARSAQLRARGGTVAVRGAPRATMRVVGP